VLRGGCRLTQPAHQQAVRTPQGRLAAPARPSLALVVVHLRVLRWYHDHGPIAEELRLARLQIAESRHSRSCACISGTIDT